MITLKWNDGEVTAILSVKDYPEEGITLDSLVPMIHDIRSNASSLVIQADMKNVPLLNTQKFKMILKIVTDVVEYTKDDNLLKRIEILNTGFIFRMVYKTIRLAIPKCFRDIISFL